MCKAQQEDFVLRQLIAWKQADAHPKWEEISSAGATLKVYWAQWDSLKFIDGVLYRTVQPTSRTSTLQVLILDKLWDEVLKTLHDAVTAAQVGVR